MAIAFILLLALGWVWLAPGLKDRWRTLAAALLVPLALWHYGGQGQFFAINPKGKPERSLAHWHELYHYYLGGKYFPELGYNGLYPAVLLADQESAQPQYSRQYIRSLKEPLKTQTKQEALAYANETLRPKFTPVRWQAFAADVAAFKAVAFPGWLDQALFDAGYNPPPSWAVWGYSLANFWPIAGESLFGWQRLEFLPLIDWVLLALAAYCIGRSFSPLVGVSFLVLFSVNQLATVGWISGSFCRYVWFAALAFALCALKKERYWLAGLCFAIAVMDRVFPVLFAFGALLPLLYTKNTRAIREMALGGAVAGVALFAISLGLFGWEAWQAFFAKITVHQEMFFVQHIGYKRIVLFGDWTPNQNFWWEQGIARMAEWNARYHAAWQSGKGFHLPLLLGMTALAGYAALRTKEVVEAALLFGAVALFLWAVPANYYYIFLPLFVLVLRGGLLVALLLLFAYLKAAKGFSPDDIVQNYYYCWGVMSFLFLSVSARLYANANRA